MARLVSLNVGLPRDVPWLGRTVHTGIFKYLVDGRRMVRRLNIDGDGQGDQGGHGGENRAVLVYQRQSYEHYLRVITEGHVQAGDEIVRTRTGRHEMSVADIGALLCLPGQDRDALRKALDIPALSLGWRGSFRDLLAAEEPTAPRGWSGFRPLRVTRVVPESTTVASLHLAAEDGAPAPPARAGPVPHPARPRGRRPGTGPQRTGRLHDGRAGIPGFAGFRPGTCPQ